MKGLALANVFVLSCIWSNANGLRLNVNVDINHSDEPGVYGRNYTVIQERTGIVGGEEVEPHSIPWQVYLKGRAPLNETHESVSSCGGTIICPRFVMSAGHCIKNEGRYWVYVGVHTVNDDLTEDRMHEVEEIHQHPQYHKNIGGWAFYDYAILELLNPIRLRLDAMAIFLPNGKEKYNRESLLLTSGWGRTSQGGLPSPDLLSVTVPWVPRGVCKDLYEKIDYFKEITPQMMCAGDIENGKIDSCQGDSGGPLAWLDPQTDQVKLSGVVSQGDGCARPYTPGVYADVANQLDWITAVTESCNEKTCQTDGHCMRKQDLVPSIIKRFETVTPHRFEK